MRPIFVYDTILLEMMCVGVRAVIAECMFFIIVGLSGSDIILF